MGSGFANWLTGTREIYFGNATAVRDYRVQLRGNRSVMLFGIYLIVLIGVAVLIYASSTAMSGYSIVDAQAHLQQFYLVTIGLLGLTVCVVAPALTATSIVMERQRQSIDLVFSAPVSPKYYLVGKMISSYRYTWMLLVLALPVTAASVVLGGASWTDVLCAYILLSVQGLILTSFALLMSTVAPKPVGAIIWSYTATLLYNFFAFAASQGAAMSMRMGHGAGSEAPCYIALSPWSVAQASRTYTTIAGHQIPNWLLMLVIALLVAKICLLGAGTLLNPSGGKEIVGLRIHGLLYAAVIAGIGGWSLWPGFASIASIPFGSSTMTSSGMCGLFAAWCTAPMFTFMPFIACHGFDRERRFRPNGMFSIRRILDGTPAGGLPFLLAMMVVLFGGVAVGAFVSSSTKLGGEYWVYALYATSFWVLFWAFGRLMSSIFPTLKMSRTLVFAAFILVAVLPFPFLVAVAGMEPDSTRFNLWNLYLLSPLVGRRPDAGSQAIILTGVMAALSLVMAYAAALRTQKTLSTIRDYDERPLQPT
jgi:hypothetical protein